MKDEEKTAVSDVARQRMRTLLDAGWEAHRNQLFLRAADIYREALDLATSIADAPSTVAARFYFGVSLLEAGKLSEALSALIPTLQDAASLKQKADFYRTLTRYIDIAQELPTTLRAINKSYAEADRLLGRGEQQPWRSRVLHLQGKLFRYRGFFQEALNAEQEGWALSNDQFPCFTADAHFNGLVHSCILLRDKVQARHYLSEWERWPNTEHPNASEISMCLRKSELARLDNDPRLAVDWARRSALLSKQADNTEVALQPLSPLIRAFLFDGNSARAREALVKFAPARHADSLHERYEFHLLRGDFHSASARAASGLDTLDDEYAVEVPVLKPSNSAAYRETIRAQAAYVSASQVGLEIDQKLECTLRQSVIAARIQRLEAL